MRRTPGIHIRVAALILLAALAFAGQNASANQQGSGINDRLGNLNGLCRLNGGTPGAYSTDTVVTRFSCQGGALDGLYCDVYADLTYCYWDGVGKGASAPASRHEITTDLEDAEIVTEVTSDTVTPLAPDVAIQPDEGIDSTTVEPVTESPGDA